MKRGMVLFIITIVLVVAVNGLADRIIYVDGDAPGANDGSNWENAYNYLQDALADANNSEKPVEIRVAQGVYRPDRSTAEPNGTGDRNATFNLIDQVTIKGGFAGYGQMDPNDRDIETFETTLSGDLVGNDVYIDNPYDLHEEISRFDNSLHVVTASGNNQTFVIDGIVIYGGHDYAQETNGGGVWMDSGNFTANGCKFLSNSATNGGAMWIGGGEAIFIKCTFEENAVLWEMGGGIYNSSGTILVKSCIFTRNVAWYGGGVFNESGGIAKFEETKFIKNGGGFGGAIYNSEAIAILNGCILRYNAGCSLVNFEGSEIIMENCLCTYNWIRIWGSVLNNKNSKATINNCTFAGNHSSYSNVSIYNYDGGSFE